MREGDVLLFAHGRDLHSTQNDWHGTTSKDALQGMIGRQIKTEEDTRKSDDQCRNRAGVPDFTTVPRPDVIVWPGTGRTTGGIMGHTTIPEILREIRLAGSAGGNWES